MEFSLFRSSLLEVFWRKGVLRNFERFTGKHLRHSLFFNKVASPRTATLSKRRLWHSRCFLVNFAKFLRTPFFIEYLRWLVLFITSYQSGAPRRLKLFRIDMLKKNISFIITTVSIIIITIIIIIIINYFQLNDNIEYNIKSILVKSIANTAL